ncbi:hypothetical protein EUX98_g9789 [Antrodiella citrinella]|uniref:Uncharacterized protein n=1 Tax=Antrodiella citrinella TaxID=2447956 RepID=A0A4S4LRK2_9APHY|nr:hypothetical protein EUX98_g9789 [Antrodiella citrinella]
MVVNSEFRCDMPSMEPLVPSSIHALRAYSQLRAADLQEETHPAEDGVPI